MAAKKRPGRNEPLLNTVARKLGRAAGTVTKVTKELTENFATLSESVAPKVRKATNIGKPRKRSRVRTRHPRKNVRRSAHGQKRKGRATAGEADLREGQIAAK